MSLPRKIATLLRAGPWRQWLVAEAVASLFVARVSLALLPFNRVARGFGTLVRPDDARAVAAGASPDQVRLARHIGWAVRAVAPYMPFRSVCLQQAMAAHAMLRRRGVAGVIHFGMAKDQRSMVDGHAWLDAAGIGVTGYPIDPKLVELGCFV